MNNKPHETRHARRFAAIDLGTNSCRMIVAQSTPERHTPFKILDAASIPVYLGEKLATSERLAEESMQRSLDALEGFTQRFAKWQPHQITAVATESFRRAENGDAFAQEIREKLDLNFDIISPKRELRYALLSCRNLFEEEKPYGLLFDIGGGSLQIAWLDMQNALDPQIIDILSIPSGLAILKDQMGTGIIGDDKLQQLKDMLAPQLKKFSDKNDIAQHIEQNHISFVGASGVLTSLTCIQYGYERYNRKQIDGEQLNIESACHVADRLRLLDRENRALYGCVGNERADMLAVGCAIVLCLFEQFPTHSIAIADRGLREGIILDMIDNAQKNP